MGRKLELCVSFGVPARVIDFVAVGNRVRVAESMGDYGRNSLSFHSIVRV
jgi:hypothetical protein